MIEKVGLLAKHPLLAANDMFEHSGLMNHVHSQERGKNLNTGEKLLDLETVSLEMNIVKIFRLLALSFGEAGSKIIAKNIKLNDELNPMQQGKRIYAIYGFCDIRNFTDSTEVLQTEVLSFVNKIAEITHSLVHKYGGQANKNIGDAFLLIWKFKDQSNFIQ